MHFSHSAAAEESSTREMTTFIDTQDGVVTEVVWGSPTRQWLQLEQGSNH
jgi:hypothetical protein